MRPRRPPVTQSGRTPSDYYLAVTRLGPTHARPRVELRHEHLVMHNQCHAMATLQLVAMMLTRELYIWRTGELTAIVRVIQQVSDRASDQQPSACKRKAPTHKTRGSSTRTRPKDTSAPISRGLCPGVAPRPGRRNPSGACSCSTSAPSSGTLCRGSSRRAPSRVAFKLLLFLHNAIGPRRRSHASRLMACIA